MFAVHTYVLVFVFCIPEMATQRHRTLPERY
jgi:hypothetical protein